MMKEMNENGHFLKRNIRINFKNGVLNRYPINVIRMVFVARHYIRSTDRLNHIIWIGQKTAINGMRELRGTNDWFNVKSHTHKWACDMLAFEITMAQIITRKEKRRNRQNNRYIEEATKTEDHKTKASAKTTARERDKSQTPTIPILGRIIANAHMKVHRHISFNAAHSQHKVNLCKSKLNWINENK